MERERWACLRDDGICFLLGHLLHAQPQRGLQTFICEVFRHSASCHSIFLNDHSFRGFPVGETNPSIPAEMGETQTSRVSAPIPDHGTTCQRDLSWWALPP